MKIRLAHHLSRVLISRKNTPVIFRAIVSILSMGRRGGGLFAFQAVAAVAVAGAARTGAVAVACSVRTPMIVCLRYAQNDMIPTVYHI